MLTQSGSKLPHSTNDSHGACPVFLWFEDFDATLTDGQRRLTPRDRVVKMGWT